MLNSCVGNRRPMTGSVGVLGRPVEKAEGLHGEVGMTGSLEVVDRLGMPQTRGLEGLHLGLLSGSLVLNVVGLSSGLVGACGRLAFAA